VLGEFWLDSAPGNRLAGELDADGGMLTVYGGELVDSMQTVQQGMVSISQPVPFDANVGYLILGRRDDGPEVTIPFAVRLGTRHAADSVEQDFTFLYALEGGHVARMEQYVGATVDFGEPWRLWLPGASWTGVVDLPRNDTVELTWDDGLRFEGLPSLTHDEIERSLVVPLRSLLIFLSHRDPQPEKLVLHRATGQSAVTVKAQHGEGAAQRPFNPVVSLRAIDASRLSAWFRLADQIVPVTTVVAKTITRAGYDVEMRILNLAASAEAIHRELYDEKLMTKEEARQIREAAVGAVPENAQQRVAQLLQQLRNLSYSERLHRILASLDGLGVEIAGRSSDPRGDTATGTTPMQGRDLWVQSVNGARNGFAHLRRNPPEDIERYAGQMHVLYQSLSWALTAVLLLDVGVSLDDIAADFHLSSKYSAFRQDAIQLWPEIYG
jgi:ApeA N-terminal domain 1